ncbi:50S ribosomal protein L11 methyltransferase [Ferruginivarius sediminum]|uniref:Ribosomal protein L11 methyltransferase n=1 Tax=Ferruginivarius sediminum TaxID=2661937 RepID=A0A369TAT6_9PROT|nr:50S ribosomal protein L11 methyltransferase [Ferruginivarius sediminum]RDD62441.1 50S ribosomal protein L11 methyltransferase [Ferruginivarius sediminum]
MEQSQGHHVHLKVPQAALEIFEAALETLGGAIVTGGPDENGEVPIDLYLSEVPDGGELASLIATAAAAAHVPEPAVDSAPLPDVDWLAKAYEGLPPIVTGRFFVYGQHNLSKPRPPGAIAFRIEANQAFGTGRHETTQGCLLALEKLAKRGVNVERALDMGTGSGILAFAIARLWRVPVLAADNDAPSITICRENARDNFVAQWVRAVVSDGYRSREVRHNGPYDLICANILAEPLTAMAADLEANLAPGGWAVLSGLLDHQARKVLYRHLAQGLVLWQRLPVGGWTTLILRKPGQDAGTQAGRLVAS